MAFINMGRIAKLVRNFNKEERKNEERFSLPGRNAFRIVPTDKWKPGKTGPP